MSQERIDALKRRARLLARDRGIGRQKALDVVAIEEGYRHWGDLLSSMPLTEDASPSVGAVGHVAVAVERDWALDHLDTMAGARTSRFDEAALNTVGAAAAAIFGTELLGTALASGVAAIVAGVLSSLPRLGTQQPFMEIITIILLLAFVPISTAVGLASRHTPHSMRYRSIRHTLVRWWICTGACLGLATAATQKDAVYSFGPSPLESALSMTVIFGAFVIPMWIGTYAGRRTR